MLQRPVTHHAPFLFAVVGSGVIRKAAVYSCANPSSERAVHAQAIRAAVGVRTNADRVALLPVRVVE